jgi:hypothetical protein
MASPPADLSTLLAKLAAADVAFVLVGGLAAVAQGAPLTTHDIDIVHSRAPDNVDRLLEFLTSVAAMYRGRPAGQVLPPTREALLGTGHSLLATSLGPLDVLGAIEGGRTYEDLLPNAVQIDIEGRRIHVLGLRFLAELKRGSTHAKDKYTLAILEETLRRLPTQ